MFGARRDERGFTLVEILAVLIILGIIVGLAVPRMIRVDDSAKQRALYTGIAELNSRENLTWAQTMLDGYTNDANIMVQIDYDIGSAYSWSDGPNEDGGILVFQNIPMTLTRTPSSRDSAAIWKEE